VITLSRPDADWSGPVGRVNPALLARHVPEPVLARDFLCGPGDFTPTLIDWLQQNGVPPIGSTRNSSASRLGVSNPSQLPAGQACGDAVAVSL
jgi:hypothetical protein